MTTRDNFLFHRSYFTALKCLDIDSRLKLLDAIFLYALEEQEVNLEGGIAGMFELIKSQIDSEKQNLANLAMLEDAKKQKRIDAGRKGGLAKASKPSNASNARSATKIDDLQPSTQSTDSKDDLANLAMLEVLESALESEKKKVPPLSPPVPPLSLSRTLTLSPPYTPPYHPLKETPTGARNKKSDEGPIKSRLFVKPSLEEIKSYCNEANLKNIEPESFFDHFESNGWKVSGKTPMQDWKAAARNWNRNNFRPKNTEFTTSESSRAKGGWGKYSFSDVDRMSRYDPENAEKMNEDARKWAIERGIEKQVIIG